MCYLCVNGVGVKCVVNVWEVVCDVILKVGPVCVVEIENGDVRGSRLGALKCEV